MSRAAMLWTGGKDCSLALYEARRAGLDISCLITFAPANPQFLAHPPAFMRLQAEALGLPHEVITIREPFAASYERALAGLRTERDISVVITGDIAEVGGSPNWIRARSEPAGLNVLTPLWGRDRQGLLEEQLAHGFRIIFSCVDTRWLAADWVGRVLDEEAVDELREIHARNGIDLCGEEGEYHTLVTDGPTFRHAVVIPGHSIRTRQGRAYLEIHGLIPAEAAQ